MTSCNSCKLLLLVLITMFPDLVAAQPALPALQFVIDDFEDGDASDWTGFSGNEAGGGFGVEADRPRYGSHYLSTGWGGNGTASDFYGGMYRNFDNGAQVPLPEDPWFSVWVFNQSNATVDQYRLEITLREDLDGNGWTDGVDESFRLDTTFPSDQFDDEWIQVSAPLSSFSDMDAWGDGVFNGALDEIVVVIAGVEGAPGSTVEVDFDRFLLSSGGGVCALDSEIVDEFEFTEIPFGTDSYGLKIGFYPFTGPGAAVALSSTDLSGNTALTLDSDVPADSWAGVIRNFSNASLDTWISQDWSDRTIIGFSVYGTNSGATLFLDIFDNRSSLDTSSPEVWTYAFIDDFLGWQRFEVPFSSFTRKEIDNGAPNDGLGLTQMHGWAFGSLQFTGTLHLDEVRVCGTVPPPPLTVSFGGSVHAVEEGESALLDVVLSEPPNGPVAVDFATAEATARAGRQYMPVSGTLVFDTGETHQVIEIPTFADGKRSGDRRVAVNLYENSAELGFLRRAVLTIVDTDAPDPGLIDDFEGFHPYVHRSGDVQLSSNTIQDDEARAAPFQGAYEDVLSAAFDTTSGAASFRRDFAGGRDWSAAAGLSFWFYGGGSGQVFTLQVRDNMAADTGAVNPEEWVLAWSDEFNDPAGTPPDINVWRPELGDGALRDILGWGGGELQYYTDETANAATDGDGHLVVSVLGNDPEATDLVCWYGPCEYTSARLNSLQRLDFQYGRIEARMRVPDGPAGLIPAFWMLGSNFPEVDWPQSGEIDIMEYVSRLPSEVFGTVHGPGYAGGAAIGDVFDLGEPVSEAFRTFTIEWGPDLITWFVDGVPYLTIIPDDAAPNEWVFDQPFFLILNTAVGGGFAGPVDEAMTFPQETLVDYVRVYQAADTAERFEASFLDDVEGWREVSLPFASFVRSSEQPAGAPDDGLTLSDIQGYGFLMPEGTTGEFLLDQVRSSLGDRILLDGFEGVP